MHIFKGQLLAVVPQVDKWCASSSSELQLHQVSPAEHSAVVSAAEAARLAAVQTEQAVQQWATHDATVGASLVTILGCYWHGYNQS
jgi:hypothetical protein